MPRLRLILSPARGTRGSVGLLFGLALLPLIMLIGLAIDYAFYSKAQAQLNLAADAAAMHAVRVASQAYGNGLTTVQAGVDAGQTAGQQWFYAQLGSLPRVSMPTSGLSVVVTYTASPGGFTAQVTYNATLTTFFGRLFNTLTWPITGTASSVISNAYVEVLMLVDNSSSMMLPSTDKDIITMEQATSCSGPGNAALQQGQSIHNAYSWTFPGGYGYETGDMIPPKSPKLGSCSAGYDGDPNVCFYPPLGMASYNAATGKCNNGNTPAAPCAFACHWTGSTASFGSATYSNDYYGVARSLKLTLRLDVVLGATANVISALQKDQESPGQFSVGVFQFSAPDSASGSSLKTVYPTNGKEADANLAAALAAVNAIQTPVVSNDGDTDFATAATALAGEVQPAGDGTTQGAPFKNLFIVTDGLQDLPGVRDEAPITNAGNETICKQFKDKGFAVYVLYTPYWPVANNYYLTYIKGIAEPTGASQITQALQACASPGNYYQASADPASIDQAMQTMLKNALNSAGRISH